jgi:triphosphoribosyl-dephospho-CoA synthase
MSDQPLPRRLSLGQCASLACIWEATTPKPGNVHRGADFENLTYLDLVTSAVAIGPVLDAAPVQRLGTSLLAAVEATRAAVATNTNLGTLLLIVPLAMVPRDEPLKVGVGRVLAGLDAEDCRLAYEAIRTAQPGGMQQVDEADLAGQPPASLVAAMRLAAERDLVARQYANGFAEVLDVVVPSLERGLGRGWALQDVILHSFLELLRDYPDSLIARKCGPGVARRASAMAAAALEGGLPGDEAYDQLLGDMDFWLRSDGHRRNPGTTADLVAAGLFVALRENIIKLPTRFYTREQEKNDEIRNSKFE